ncbi:hypothetical protein ACFLZC_00240 [Patescibacteria group bacterium]
MDGIIFKKPEPPKVDKPIFHEEPKIPKSQDKPQKGKKKTIIVSAVVLFLFSASAVGAYGVFQKASFNKLVKNASFEFENGNYSAALVLYDKMKEREPEDSNISFQVEKTKKLLIAEENYFKAKTASENEEWFDVAVLLKDSEAINNSEFKFYKEAQKLYQGALDLVNQSESETAGEITDLRKSIVEEKSARQQAESQLQQTASQKQNTEDQLKSTKQELYQTQNSIANTQSQLELEQQKAKELAIVADKERLDKFYNEVDVYVEMLKRGNGYLNDTISEIDEENELTPSLYLGQAKVLFDEAKSNTEDLRAKRTPSGFSGTVDSIIRSADLFNDAIKSFKKAVAFMGEEEFNGYYNEAKDTKIKAYQLANSISQ